MSGNYRYLGCLRRGWKGKAVNVVEIVVPETFTTYIRYKRTVMPQENEVKIKLSLCML